MAREDLARDFDSRSSPRFAGAAAGTALRLASTVTPAASNGSALHGIVSVPAGVPAPARTPDAPSSTVACTGFTNEYDSCSALAGGQYGF